MDDLERARLTTAEEQWIAKYRDAISQINTPPPRGGKIRTAFDEVWRRLRSVLWQTENPHTSTGERGSLPSRPADNDHGKIQPFSVPLHSSTRAPKAVDRHAKTG
jgi:hypothetical protein